MGKLYLLFLLLAVLAISTVSADIVETRDGARLVGKVLQIDGTLVVLDTAYAGEVKIKQSEVTGITTDKPTNIRLSTGAVLQGTLTSDKAGVVMVSSSNGAIVASVDKIIATWAPNAVDPAVLAMRRAWTYEATVDAVGKTGNSDQVGTGFSFRAALSGQQDKLQFYSAYDRQVTQGQRSADQLKAGVDYQNSFSGRYLWYVRDEAGFDRVKLIELTNVAATGLGYDFIKKPKQTLTFRGGLANRYEIYKEDPELYAELVNPTPPGVPLSPDEARTRATKPRVNSTEFDFGLSHSLELFDVSLVTRISFTPSVTDFTDYRLVHESFLEIPLHNLMWKLRMGVSDDYTSKPAVNTKRLDTTYFTHFVLKWK